MNVHTEGAEAEVEAVMSAIINMKRGGEVGIVLVSRIALTEAETEARGDVMTQLNKLDHQLMVTGGLSCRCVQPPALMIEA